MDTSLIDDTQRTDELAQRARSAELIRVMLLYSAFIGWRISLWTNKHHFMWSRQYGLLAALGLFLCTSMMTLYFFHRPVRMQSLFGLAGRFTTAWLISNASISCMAALREHFVYGATIIESFLYACIVGGLLFLLHAAIRILGDTSAGKSKGQGKRRWVAGWPGLPQAGGRRPKKL